jgi:hypothetical protein
MQVLLNQGLPDEELDAIRKVENLEDLLRWGFRQPLEARCAEVIADFVVHDEFTHDVLVPWKGRWLVYHST